MYKRQHIGGQGDLAVKVGIDIGADAGGNDQQDECLQDAVRALVLGRAGLLHRLHGLDVYKRQAERHGCVRYRFTVQDTGIGISDEFLNRLFEPFNRSKKVSKVEGTGLGLSITKGLVDLMGGTIQVESKLGQGTKFEVELEFDLPSDQEQYCRDVPIEVEPGDLSGYHFLLVEDNEINSAILGELLQMWGATFTLRCDGLQAVNEFDQSEPGTYDAIFMDIQMPVMNGYEAAREIRKLAHPDAASTVSYTHLDVYKRQLLMNGSFSEQQGDMLLTGMVIDISHQKFMEERLCCKSRRQRALCVQNCEPLN